MKIGIITIHNSPSYGACLQSYALYLYLSMQPEVDCEIIDLHRPYQADYIASRRYRPYQSSFGKLKLKIKHLRNCLLNKKKPIYYSVASIQKFKDFNEKIKTSQPYFSIDSLYSNPPEYDIYITGSDQVWNPLQPYCMEPFFLTFVPEGKKRISYAASIGIATLPKEMKKKYKEWLSKYDEITVRENEAKHLLESFINKSVVQVSDPTFLLDVGQWESLSLKPAIDKPYILYFGIYGYRRLFDYALRLSNESGMPLYNLAQVQSKVVDNSYIPVTDAGPQEFLGYIANADMVITDSFHGTAFSILMGTKNFYTYIAPNNRRGSRIRNLLETYGLSHHTLDTKLNESFFQLSSNEICRTDILSIILQEQNRSRNFLLSYIKHFNE